ncbi:MAG: glutamate racemase [Treponema sp.]|nr:glutamate racemase [Treponema sp.]
MDNRPVLFIDSGIGGIPYCRDFQKKNLRENICYAADRKYFPYGPRGKDELLSILIELTEKLIRTIDPKIAVIACNTATVSALDSLRQTFTQLHFVGTVPAIKPAAKSGKIGVLGTSRTIEDPYNKLLAQDCGIRENIFGLAAPELVEFVEQRFDEADDNEKTEIVRKYIRIFQAEGAGSIVLGCTHFLYLIDEFRREAAPSISIFDSLDGVTRRIEFLLDENNGMLRASNVSGSDYRLLLTGTEPPDPVWKNRSQKLGFTLHMLDTL